KGARKSGGKVGCWKRRPGQPSRAVRCCYKAATCSLPPPSQSACAPLPHHSPPSAPAGSPAGLRSLSLSTIAYELGVVGYDLRVSDSPQLCPAITPPS
uniref:Uncharacterized protein n=1 Tax=Aegilops tauschii subsp. strangulata TaxID=200361 RepID=A0A453FY76_AEGTS